MKFRYVLGAVLALVPSSFVSAQEWADLEIRFVLDGAMPELKAIDGKNDPVCAKFDIPNERLVVNEKNKGIANLVFMVDSKQSKLADNQIHPSLKEVPADKVLLDNLQCKFTPHVFHVRAGQTVDVKNSDTTSHNAKFAFFNNPESNFVIPSNESRPLTIKKAESSPTKVECNIHPWMAAYPVVTDHPYVGISDADGVVKIAKLPAGVELTFKLWHESQNKFDEITVNGKAESWKKGNVKYTLKAGANNLGTGALKPDKFKP